MIRNLVVKHFWKVVNVLCCVAFLFQFYGVVYEWVRPTQSTTEVEDKNLEDFEFPVVFKICVNPGFNITALREEGYYESYDYFLGRSRYNRSQYGWAGHYNGSFHRDTVEGMDIFRWVPPTSISDFSVRSSVRPPVIPSVEFLLFRP